MIYIKCGKNIKKAFYKWENTKRAVQISKKGVRTQFTAKRDMGLIVYGEYFKNRPTYGYGYGYGSNKFSYSYYFYKKPGMFKAQFSGVKSIYNPSEEIVVSVKGIEEDGAPASPGEGFNVQAYIFDLERTKTYQGVNGSFDYNTNLWTALLTAPTDTSKTYNLEATLYFSNNGSQCAQKYNSGAYAREQFNFSLTATSTPCADSDGGKNYTQAGVCQDANGAHSDTCDTSEGFPMIKEYYCDADVCVADGYINCNIQWGNSCSNGACAAATSTPSP